MARGFDVVLEKNADGVYDVSLAADGDLETADSFDTYVTVALFTDRRADASEVADPIRRRGWPGNEYTPGEEMGSKLWLYEQARRTATTASAVESVIADALQSLVDEGFADAIRGVELEVTDEGARIALSIERSPGKTEKRYYDFWQNTGAL